MPDKRKIYVVDLDGTLCKTPEKAGHDNDYTPQYFDAVPYYDRVKKINKLHDEGHIIIIETSRGCVSGKKWFYETVKQLKEWGLQFDTLRAGVKFMGDVYIDDKAVNASEFFGDSKNSDVIRTFLKKESGSGNKTRVVLVNRVLKEATDERMDKLIDEIDFIESVPENFKNHLPQVVVSQKNMNSEKVYYEMAHYNLPTIRRLILSEVFDSQDILYWTNKVMEFAMEMYRYEVIEMPDNYLDIMHYDRLRRRLAELTNKSSIFNEIVKERKLIINGREYDNIPFMVDKLNEQEIRESVTPEFVGRWSHSDLHYSNILVDVEGDNFVLIDPRGYKFCDYYYDFGKLWHSVNGKYELISSGLFELQVKSVNSYDFRLTNENIVNTLEEVKKELPTTLSRYSNETQDKIVLKTEFNECIHFASLIPFLLAFDGREEKAIIAYITATVLINQFMDKYFKPVHSLSEPRYQYQQRCFSKP